MVPELRTPGATRAAKPPVVGGDPSEIDDRGGGISRDVEIVVPGHEAGEVALLVAVDRSGLGADVAGGGEESRSVDARMGAEQDAVAVDDEDAAIGGQGAVDQRGSLPADDAVERGRGAVRLIERRGLAGPDIERGPIDDGILARLIDDHHPGALALDAGGAAHHGAAIGAGVDRHRGERKDGRQRRRRGKPARLGRDRDAGFEGAG
jgi:hypothetical protein